MANQKPVAIVTGASSGIGLAIAQALLARGFNVVGTSRSATRSKVLQAGTSLALVDGDISLKETAVKVASTALEKFGRVDLLVNNAGMFMPKPFTEYTEEDFALMIGTNVASYFFMTQQVVPIMQRQKEGHVVSISTTMTDQPIAGVPAVLPVITKSVMPASAKALSIEFAPDNIRFNVISPGVVDTPMHKDSDPAQLAKFSPLKRVITTDEIVDTVLYLQSAKSVSGENIRVDGGAHAGRW